MADNEDKYWLSSQRVGSALAGAAYILFFLPLCLWTAIQQNVSFFKTLLLIEVPPNIAKFFSEFSVPSLSMADIPFFAAVGIAYGVLCILYTLITYAFRGYGPVKLITSANGFFWGYLIAIEIGRVFFDLKGLQGIEYRTHVLKFLYVYLLFIAFTVIRENVTFNRPWRPQFDMLFDGLFGILSSLLIVFGYQADVAGILLGPIFLITSFIAMIVSEAIFARMTVVMLYTFEDLGKPENIAAADAIHASTNKPFKKLLRFFLGRVRFAWGRPMAELVRVFHGKTWKKSFARTNGELLTIRPTIVLGVFLFFALWPIIMGGLLWVMIDVFW